MGQCQYCRRVSTMSTTDSASPGKGRKYVMNGGHNSQEALTGKNSGSDSALESAHSYYEEGSCGKQGRGSHSSESSGKYSLRESIGSLGDCERSHSSPGPTAASPIELQVLHSPNNYTVEGSRNVTEGATADEDALRPLQDLSRVRKVSKGSNCSERGSLTSVASVTAVLRARLGRSASLKVRRPRAESEALGHESPAMVTEKRPRRAVSLRLPRSHRRAHDADTNLPTIYVEDSPRSKGQQGREYPRKSSLRRALSLLSMNSLRQESLGHQKPHKPVQKILRQPRRRHTTVRGLSGMAIDAANQSGLQRSNTLYYPTATSMRHAYAARRTYSDQHT
ncbi:hypothetical protein Hamer_G004855 [Homarus americanus]|uniref:Uncharacterized protein n=1 Tax=Homarus americanus TaxID=6706 RepID=A0A8J5MVM9_HOMAM|nr:hypothetical protein Hamer_G004855 [Homarus americanus]